MQKITDTLGENICNPERTPDCQGRRDQNPDKNRSFKNMWQPLNTWKSYLEKKCKLNEHRDIVSLSIRLTENAGCDSTFCQQAHGKALCTAYGNWGRFNPPGRKLYNTYQTSETHFVFAPTALLLRTTLKVNLQTQIPQNYHAQGFSLCNRRRLETI